MPIQRFFLFCLFVEPKVLSRDAHSINLSGFDFEDFLDGYGIRRGRRGGGVDEEACDV